MSKNPAVASYVRWLRRSVDDATDDMTPQRECEYLRKRLVAEVVKCARIKWSEPRTDPVPDLMTPKQSKLIMRGRGPECAECVLRVPGVRWPMVEATARGDAERTLIGTSCCHSIEVPFGGEHHTPNDYIFPEGEETSRLEDATAVFTDVLGKEAVQIALRKQRERAFNRGLTNEEAMSALDIKPGRDLAEPTGGPLEYCGENDYRFPEGEETSFWVTVGTISVWVRRHGSGVIVELLRHRDECEGDLLGSCEASY